MMNTIYGLRDPRDGRIRYVGKTVRPGLRYDEHLRDAHLKRTHKECWLAGLLEAGLAPDLVILETLVDGQDWAQAERRWITAFEDLTNGTAGGDGGNMPAAQTPEARAKRAAANRGQKRGEEFRERRRAEMLARAPLATDVRARISATLKASDRRGAQIPSARLTEADVVRILDELADGLTGADVARKYGVTAANVSAIRLGKSWAHVPRPQRGT